MNFKSLTILYPYNIHLHQSLFHHSIHHISIIHTIDQHYRISLVMQYLVASISTTTISQPMHWINKINHSSTNTKIISC